MRKSQYAIAGVGIAVLLAMILRARFVDMQHREKLTADPTELSHENDIRKASEALLREVSSPTSRQRSEAIVQLERVMIKLRDGWPGFVVDQYYPHDYTAHSLLGELYWSVAKVAAADPRAVDRDLSAMLNRTRPTVESGQLWQSFDYALSMHPIASPPPATEAN